MAKLETVMGADMDGKPMPIDVPHFHATHFTVMATEDEVNLLCASAAPAFDNKGEVGLARTPVAFMTMSPGAAKRLVNVLNRYVEDYEESQSGEEAAGN